MKNPIEYRVEWSQVKVSQSDFLNFFNYLQKRAKNGLHPDNVVNGHKYDDI